jgi:hypothetical protein
MRWQMGCIEVCIFNIQTYNLMNKILLITLSLITALTASAQTEEDPSTFSYSVYCNARFGYCVQYPDQVLLPQPESMNGDGRSFQNKKGEVVLSVYGEINEDEDGNLVPIAQQYEKDLKQSKKNASPGDTITYKKLGKTFYVVSGYKKGKIFYEKVIAKDGTFCFAYFNYSPADKEVYNSISTTIFSSFK